jgi:hypothetical protein
MGSCATPPDFSWFAVADLVGHQDLQTFLFQSVGFSWAFSTPAALCFKKDDAGGEKLADARIKLNMGFSTP